MVINKNLHAISLANMVKVKNWETNKTAERVASGLRINRSGDDPAGLAVSEKMRSQITGLRQAERNTEDGISFVQTTEAYLDETSEVLRRIRKLAVQASNGVYTNKDRQLFQVELSQLVDEVDRIASQAEYNRLRLLQGEFAQINQKASMWLHVGGNMHQREQVFISTMTAAGLDLKDTAGVIKASLSSPETANMTIGLIDFALTKLGKQRADLGSYYQRMEHTAKNLMNSYASFQEAASVTRDADVAEEMVAHTKDKIILDSANAMLAQASSNPKRAMELLHSSKYSY